MKFEYWSSDPPQPDSDDIKPGEGALWKEIELGTVPPTCLLGGTSVTALRLNGVKPCHLCKCPRRDLCGGEMRIDQKAAELMPSADAGEESQAVQAYVENAMGSGDAADVRRAERRITIQALNALVEEEENKGAQ